jgi:hypothetical protein
MKSTNPENDFVSEPPNIPEPPHQFKVGDKVTFGMPWMGGRTVCVMAQIVEIDEPNALLKTIGFFDAGDETGIEPLANLSPFTQEYEADLRKFDD